MIPVSLLGTGSALLGEPRTTRALIAHARPDADADALERRIGIAARHWIPAHETAAHLGALALERALAAAHLEARALQRVLFVSSTGGDHLVPATANDLLAAFDLDDSCDAFDVNNACVGFLSALDIAARSVATGLGPVAVVVAETLSRHLGPEAPRSYLVLGDAAACAILGPGPGQLTTWLRNSAALRGQMSTPHPGRSRERALIQFAASSAELTASARDAIRKSTCGLFGELGLGWPDIDWFIPHQPSREMLTTVLRELPISSDRIVTVVSEIGSVGAASIPFALDRLVRSRRLTPGARVLLTSFGAGTAYGAALYQAGP